MGHYNILIHCSNVLRKIGAGPPVIIQLSGIYSYPGLLPRSNIHKLITKTILRIDTIKEISCKTFF